MKYKYKSINLGNMRVNQHTLVAEKALGRALPKGAIVHHSDENGMNNDPSNLVICPSMEYHKLIHKRMEALDACGNAGWLKCVRCGVYDDPENLYLYTPKDQKSPRGEHRKCHADLRRARRVA